MILFSAIGELCHVSVISYKSVLMERNIATFCCSVGAEEEMTVGIYCDLLIKNIDTLIFNINTILQHEVSRYFSVSIFSYTPSARTDVCSAEYLVTTDTNSTPGNSHIQALT